MGRLVVRDIVLLKILIKHYGYFITSRAGSHVVLRDQKGHRTTIPYHNRELTQYTLHNILRETGLSRDSIEKYV